MELEGCKFAPAKPHFITDYGFLIGFAGSDANSMNYLAFELQKPSEKP
jgi:hypothetical protein